MRRAIAAMTMAMVTAACGDAAAPSLPPPATTAATTTTTTVPATTIPATTITTTVAPTSTTVTTTVAIDRGDVPEAFTIGAVTVAGETWTVAVAETLSQRQRGLMFVTDLGDLDGMLFVFPQDNTGGFWMKDTLLPLEVAFFDASGGLVDVLAMVPCEADPCLTYVPSGAYRYALEAEPGPLGRLPAGAQLVVGTG